MTTNIMFLRDMKTMTKRGMNIKQGLAKAMLLMLLFLVGGMVSEAWAQTYTYKVIDSSGTEVASATSTSSTLGVPDVIKAVGCVFRYYDTAAHAQAMGNDGEMTSLPESDATIYVGYRYSMRIFPNPSNGNYVRLSQRGQQNWNMINYDTANGSFSANNSNSQKWQFDGNPYKLTIKNEDGYYIKVNSNSTVTATTKQSEATRFIILVSSGNGDNPQYDFTFRINDDWCTLASYLNGLYLKRNDGKSTGALTTDTSVNSGSDVCRFGIRDYSGYRIWFNVYDSYGNFVFSRADNNYSGDEYRFVNGNTNDVISGTTALNLTSQWSTSRTVTVNNPQDDGFYPVPPTRATAKNDKGFYVTYNPRWKDGSPGVLVNSDGTQELDLTGNTRYYIKFLRSPNKYMYADTWIDLKFTNAVPTVENTNFQWTLEGRDPNHIIIRNVKYNTKVVSTPGVSFVYSYPEGNSDMSATSYQNGSSKSDPTPSLADFDSSNPKHTNQCWALLSKDGTASTDFLAMQGTSQKVKVLNAYGTGGNTGNITTWDVQIYGNSHQAAVVFVPVPDSKTLKYIVKDATSGVEYATKEYSYTTGTTGVTVAIPDELRRAYCTYEGCYTDASFNTEASATVTMSDDITIYVKCAINSTGQSVFSENIGSAKWFHLKNFFNRSAHYVVSSDAGVMSIPTTFDASDATSYDWCFIGTPYDFKIYNRKAGKYVKPATATSTSNGTTTVTADASDELTSWEAYHPYSNSNECSIILKDSWMNYDPTDNTSVRNHNPAYLYPNDKRLAIEAINTSQYFDFTVELPKSYTYHIVDTSNRIAISYTLPVSEGQFPGISLDGTSGHSAIPSAIYSRYLENETLTFYAFDETYDASRLTNGNKVTVLPSNKTNIYVTYTTDHLMEKPLHLRGTRSFEMKAGREYIYETEGAAFAHTSTFTQDDTHYYLWKVTGNDPYAVQVQNVKSSNYITANTSTSALSLQGDASADSTRFIIIGGNQSDPALPSGWDDQFELMVASGQDAGITTKQYRIGNDNGVTLLQSTGGTSHVQLQFKSAELNVTYHVIDLHGKEAFSVESNSATIELPEAFKSPLASDFKYYDVSQFTVDNGTYSLKASPTELANVADATNGDIYVKYTANLTTVDLDGRNTGKMYRLKFANGDTFHQENGDAVRTDLRKAVYPYSNGDASFYVYGEEKWNEDINGASTTRTRWAWYVEGNDPYRVKISSYQTQTKQNEIERHAYFRTYIPSGYTEVVTGSITDNTAASAAGDIPSEYMLLGSVGAYKLVTISEVGSDNAGYESTNFRVVNSLEQYWKNNPTVTKKLADGGQGSVTDEALTAAQQTYMEGIDNTDHPWHTYTAWANAQPWVARTDGTTNKQYEYKKHWYQTINMGDGTFNFEDINFYGAIVLVDNHGWEIMRKTMLPEDDASYANRQAEIRAFDSPMVEQYRFWSDMRKTDGYHIYRTNESSVLKGTGTSLADAPFIMGSNGIGTDIYVTYTVKQRYRDIYDPKNGTCSESFVIRQGSKLAKTTDGSTITYTEVNTTGIPSGAATDLDAAELHWYLKPNTTIDREMGYLYSGETGAQDDAPTKAEYDKANLDAGLNVFDPYNVQIESKSKSRKFFTTNATEATLSSGVWNGNGSSVNLQDSVDADAGKYTATGHDAANCHVTNQTFMAVQDANGNMRLMPRFDQKKVLQEFTTLATSEAAQPYDDESGSQTTRLYQPNQFTYIVIDNQGREALRYTTISSGAPEIPHKYASPLAKDFTFYKTYTTPGTLSSLADEITGSFAAASVNSGNIYVRYNYDADNDLDAILKGGWFTMTLNSEQVGKSESGSNIVRGSTNGTWRFMKSAADTPDPYAVQFYNRSNMTAAVTTDRYIVFRHSDYTDANHSYALMQAGNTSTNEYAFLDGSNATAANTAMADYVTAGTTDEAKKIVLTPAYLFTNVTYNLVTHTGKIVLSDTEAVGTDKKLSLPEWMRTPVMDTKAYTYYPGATLEGGAYIRKGEPTETVHTLDDATTPVVYVYYDYPKWKKATANNPMSATATLDLSGHVPYFLANTGDASWLWYRNNAGTEISIVQRRERTDGTYNNRGYLHRHEANMVWYLTGDDPYEFRIANYYDHKGNDYGNTVKYVSVHAHTFSTTDQSAVLRADRDATENLNTFMLLQGSGDNSNKLVVYVSGNENLFLAEANSTIRVEYDATTYRTRRANNEKTQQYYDNTETFSFYPSMAYHVITNEGKEALACAAPFYSDGDDTNTYETIVQLPRKYQTPLIKQDEYTYHTTKPEWNVETRELTFSSDDKTIAAKTALTTPWGELIGDLYVRYSYDPEKSQQKFPNSQDLTDKAGLDLNGNTWYNMAVCSGCSGTSPQYDRALYVESGENDGKLYACKQSMDLTNLNTGTNPTYNLSHKQVLWRLEGNDPYAIKIHNAHKGLNKYLAGTSTTGQQSLTFTDDASADYISFMYLTTSSNADTGELGATFIPTGHLADNRTFNNSSNEILLYAWTSNNSPLYTRIGTERQGYSHICYSWISFYKAPVARKYHYHAVRFEGTENKGVTWDAVLEHDWLTPVVLEDKIARLYSKYEKFGTTNEFHTRDELTAAKVSDTYDARFYSDASLSQPVKDPHYGDNLYPEIDVEEVYDIYFKYQVDNSTEYNGRKLSDITSTAAQIAADKAYYIANGRLDPKYYKGDSHANWFFMVLDTDEDVTTTVSGSTRTPVGRQLFLRREDDGTVNWMNNDYTLHFYEVDNYKNWSYNRLAEWYRKGDNDAFREGRWLWTFVGDDPYNMHVLNMESVVGVSSNAEGVYTLDAADNCYATISEVTTDTDEKLYPITVPTSEPAENQNWGLCIGESNSSEQTLSLLSTAFTTTQDNQTVNQTLYWHMVSRTANNVTTESVEGMPGNTLDRSYAIQLLPYEPVTYEDVKVVIRRDDEVETYDSWKSGKTEAEKIEYVNNTMTTGISKLYFAASERMYVAGDEINTSNNDALPLQVRRAFCNYTMYSDIFEHSNSIYTVKSGPYPDYSKPKTGQYDEDGRQIYAYYNVDTNGDFTGDEVTSGAQAIYVKYEVTSDIFLKTAPTEAEVATMANNNDHVYFMDFPDNSAAATYHHAYYDPMSTMRSKTGDLTKQVDTKTGTARPEKRILSGSSFVDDRVNWYNHYEYRTTHNRMESVPENLKWYFVGDPYKVQVFSTAGEWNTTTLKDKNGDDITGKEVGKVAANLARFNPVETNFQFVVDCVNLRLPNYSVLDDREELQPYKEDGTIDTEATPYHNRHYGKPYFDDFYWECVPTTSGDAGTFALRFKEDNQLLGYRNVYYYLAHDGLSKTYENKSYSINLSYNADNAKHETGTYAGYHTANDKNTVIKLVQPAKVYVTVHREGDERYDGKTEVVTDELSEYYGLGETISEVPRHLQRKFVKYSNLTDKDEITASEHLLSLDKASTSELCSDVNYHKGTDDTTSSSDVFVTGTTINPIFKFMVYYTIDDLSTDKSGNDAHLFSPSTESLNWVDMAVMGNGSNWFFFDKTGSDNTKVTNYRTAVGDNTADGWNDGLKGLHWALVGDPYDFTILNRRRLEDGEDSEAQWMTVTKTTIPNYTGSVPNDSVIWTTSMVATPTATNTSTATAALSNDDQVSHFSTQMWKLSPQNSNGTYQTGNADAYYFLRTASLKTGENDVNNNSTSPINQTNNYWRMVAKAYTPSGASSPTSYFEMVPYSLSDKNTYTNTLYLENYSSTMNGLGVTQQRLEIRTAVAEDEDDADNNCFDADVEIRTMNGVLKLRKSNAEIRYGDIQKALPASLRRYGCTYKCYLNYDPATNSGTEITNFGELEGEEGYTDLQAAMTAATEAHTDDPTKSPRPLLTYVYTVEETTSQFFTTEQDAHTSDYTWANSYFYWEQTYTGSSVEVEKTKLVFDHYVYNSEGKIIDEVWREVSYTEVVSNPTTPYPTKGYLNTHNGQTPVYADQTVQSSENYQKWSMTGDPYGFTMKNYAQYLTNTDAIVSMSGTDVVTQNYGDGQTFAYVVDKNGTPYLAIIDSDPESATYGNIIQLVDFEFSSTSNKTLMTVGDGVNEADATGNSLATTYTNSSGKTATVKPFYLVNLMNYADMVDYHLVMAHQYSLDTDTRGYLTSDQKDEVDQRLYEFLKYWGLTEKRDSTYYLTYDSYGKPTGYKTSLETDINTLLKQKGTLRNFLSYPVEDAIVERVGVGNKPQVPWYMKRQFCTYHLYQRDVLRSVTDKEHPSFQQVDDEWTGKTCTIVSGGFYTDYEGTSYTANDAFVAYYAGQTFKSNDGTNPIPMTFEENGVTKQAFNVKWESIFDESSWSEWDGTSGTEGTDYKTIDGRKYKIPSGYTEASNLQGVELDKIYECHQNRRVIIDVIYEVNSNTFRFATKGRNTTAWYQMMTNNYTADGLLNFSYKDGIGGRLDRTHHYTNNYLWAPEGDPYGFVLRSRYATINGTGWDDVAVTTEGKLPKGEDQWGNAIYIDGSGTKSDFTEPTVAEAKASYTGSSSSSTIPFDHKRIIHRRTGDKIDPEGGDSEANKAQTDGATNAVYEMFVGGFDGTFLMHPTSAYYDTDDSNFESYFMVHNTTEDNNYKAHQAYLRKYQSDDLRYLADANWRLICTNEQLLPYFDRAGYVGGLKPTVAQNFTNQEYYNQLKDGTELSFTDLTKIQELVYGGTFYKSDGKTKVDYTDVRPTGTDLPMTFVSTNLVNMTDGYYRIKAFSEEALNTDGADLAGDGSNITGIIGPRYISGYRFESEKTDPDDEKNNGGRWLHFLETDMGSSTIHTYGDLLSVISDVDNQKDSASDRDQISHPAMAGNIEILPADFDPSSIFKFTATTASNDYPIYNVGTQGLKLWARPGTSETTADTGTHEFGRTELVESTPSATEGYGTVGINWSDQFRIADIGGAAMTLRTLKQNTGAWDTDVVENLKTNYVCIDRNHRYRITCHTDNEMVEIGDHYTTDGLNGIQDTKWLLQPVGIHEEWPYNEMPLRVEVQQGGVKDQDLTGDYLTAEENKDKYYYGSLYVPFDTRLSNTTDAAFTLVTAPKANTTTVTMQSVSQLNGMGNPQFVPAGWPVVVRTNLAGSITLKNQNASTYATKHYVNMYLPNVTPLTGLDDEKATILLRGEYLERTLTNSYIDGIESKTIMVFGLPFKAHIGDNAYEYDRNEKQVGWYTNENWKREDAPTATARTATDDQRSNLYVYHNKVYYPFTPITSSTKQLHIIALFDDELPEPADPETQQATTSDPWPCDVYDLQGRRVAENETPETLLRNHPNLPKGIYLFGHKKVTVK